MIPFKVVEKAVTGEPEAINAVLYHYRGYIKYRSVFQGHFNADILASKFKCFCLFIMVSLPLGGSTMFV